MGGMGGDPTPSRGCPPHEDLSPPIPKILSPPHGDIGPTPRYKILIIILYFQLEANFGYIVILFNGFV